MTDRFSSAPVVLVLSGADDAEAVCVAQAVADRGARVCWCDTAAFPTSLVVSAVGPEWSGTLRTGGHAVRLEDVRAAYFRRPGEFVFPEGMSDAERRFARTEAWLGLGGLFAAQAWRWVNHPSSLADAEFKPRQLSLARVHGLRVPRTLLTNQRQAAAEFFADIGGPVVCKPFSTGIVPEDGGLSMIYTRTLTPGDLDYPGISTTMHLFQELVPKKCDVRVNAVGDQVFAAAIHAGSAEASVDFRADYASLTYDVIDVPDDVRTGIAAYLKAARLRFAACDFVIDGTDQWWFLEANPNGMWAWIEEETGLPITAAIAGELLRDEP